MWHCLVSQKRYTAKNVFYYFILYVNIVALHYTGVKTPTVLEKLEITGLCWQVALMTLNQTSVLYIKSGLKSFDP